MRQEFMFRFKVTCLICIMGAALATIIRVQAAAPDNTDPRVTRIVERAIAHEKWQRESVRLGLMTREDWESDPDAASLLDEREAECK